MFEPILTFPCFSLIPQAGPFTKYARRYRSDTLDMCDVDSHETGVKLAQVLLQKLDPYATQPEQPQEQQSVVPPLPVFTQPKIVSAMLPGNLLYVSTKPPATITPVYASVVLFACSSHFLLACLQTAVSGRTLVTNQTAGLEANITSVHVNKLGVIDEIASLSKASTALTLLSI